MLLTSARLRRLSIVVSTALCGAVVTPAVAMAGAPVSPTISDPTEDAVITSSPVSVTATTGVVGPSTIRFDLGSGPIDSDEVATDGGVATGSLEVFGVKGLVTITATDCTPACGAPGGTVQIDVELPKPTITSPKSGDFVRDVVDVKAGAPGGSLQYSLDGASLGSPIGAPFDRRVSLRDASEGQHTISVQQCNAAGDHCAGATKSVTVTKDTRAPRWSIVSASNKTVFPVRDHYKDTTHLTARVNERLANAVVEIRVLGGRVVRTLKLGRESAGWVGANWNGRTAGGAIVPQGRYTYRFIGTDRSGLTGKSDSKRLSVSHKQLVGKTVTKTVTALGSGYANLSGACSGVYSLDYRGSKYGWRGGLGYYSRSECNGSSSENLSLALHRTAAPKAVRYGSLRIDTYGGGAVRHAGPGIIAYVKSDGHLGSGGSVPKSLGWHAGRTVNANAYLRKGRVNWAFGTDRGNGYDVKEFRLTFRIQVLR
jgi:flagellar hook assembly protein FlgD